MGIKFEFDHLEYLSEIQKPWLSGRHGSTTFVDSRFSYVKDIQRYLFIKLKACVGDEDKISIIQVLSEINFNSPPHCRFLLFTPSMS